MKASARAAAIARAIFARATSGGDRARGHPGGDLLRRPAEPALRAGAAALRRAGARQRHPRQLEGNINGGFSSCARSSARSRPSRTRRRSASGTGRQPDRQRSEIHNIAAAPDLVVTMVYPPGRNGPVLGLDYRNNPQQRGAALRARPGRADLRRSVDLVQGARASSAASPSSSARPTAPFWGLVSAVVDLEASATAASTMRPAGPRHHRPTRRRRCRARFYGAQTGHRQLVRRRMRLEQVAIAAPAGGAADRITSAAVPGIERSVLPQIVVACRRWLTCATHAVLTTKARPRGCRASDWRSGDLAPACWNAWSLGSSSGMRERDLRLSNKGGPRARARIGRLRPDDRERAAREFRDAIDTRGRYYSEFRVLLDGGGAPHPRQRWSTGLQGELRIVGVNWFNVGRRRPQRGPAPLQHAVRRATPSTNRPRRASSTTPCAIRLPACPTAAIDDVLARMSRLRRRRARRPAAHRPRPLQADQRHARPCRRRRHAGPCRGRAARRRRAARLLRPRQRRRVRHRRTPPARQPLEDLPARLAATIVERMRRRSCSRAMNAASACRSALPRHRSQADPRRLFINADMALYRAKGQRPQLPVLQ